LLPAFDRGLFALLHLPTLSSDTGSVDIMQISVNVFSSSMISSKAELTT
jgi:hypothetical protein